MSLRSVLLPVVLIASPLSAQGSRIAVGPFGAHRWASSLYEHDVRYVFTTPSEQEGSIRHRERIRIGSSSLAGARLEYRVRPAWRVYAEGAYGRASYEFHERTQGGSTKGGTFHERWIRNDATIVSLGMGVGRQFQPRAGGPVIETSVGGAIDRTRLDKRVCVPPPPSSGFVGGCDEFYGGAYARVEPRYDVPSVTGGLAVHQQVHRRVEIRTAARYAYGRADTRSMRQVGLAPGAVYHAPPASHWFGVPQLSAGATLMF